MSRTPTQTWGSWFELSLQQMRPEKSEAQKRLWVMWFEKIVFESRPIQTATHSTALQILDCSSLHLVCARESWILKNWAAGQNVPQHVHIVVIRKEARIASEHAVFCNLLPSTDVNTDIYSTMVDSALPQKTWRDAGFCKLHWLHHSNPFHGNLNSTIPRITGLASEVWPWVGFRLKENPGTSNAKHEVRYYFSILCCRYFSTHPFLFYFDIDGEEHPSSVLCFFLFEATNPGESSVSLPRHAVPPPKSCPGSEAQRKLFCTTNLFPELSVFLMTARVFSTVRLLDDCSLL